MKTVFWDFDGTLVYSNSLWSKSVLRALQEADPTTNVTWEQIRPLMWNSYTWDSPFEDHSKRINDAWWHPMLTHIYTVYQTCGVEKTIAKTATDSFRNVIYRKENYELYSDTIDVLTEIKSRGIQNVLLSNNYPELDEVVEKLGLSPLLDGMIISAKEGYDKPRQELFDIAKRRYPADHYFMVGDNPFADIEGGKRANMTTILVHHTPVSQADYCFETLTKILSVI